MLVQVAVVPAMKLFIITALPFPAAGVEAVDTMDDIGGSDMLIIISSIAMTNYQQEDYS